MSITNFRIKITAQAEAKLRNAPIDRLPACAIREQYAKLKNRNKVYIVRGLNDVMLHCQPTDKCVYIIDIDSPCETPRSIVKHTQMQLQDASFDDDRLKPASEPTRSRNNGVRRKSRCTGRRQARIDARRIASSPR